MHFKNFNVLLSSNTSGSLPNNQPTRPRRAAPFVPPLFPSRIELLTRTTRAEQPNPHTLDSTRLDSIRAGLGQITTHLITSLSSSTILHCHCRTMATATGAPWMAQHPVWPGPGCWLALDVALANRLIILSRVGQTPNKNATRRPVMCSHSSSSCSKVRQARMGCHRAGGEKEAARLLNFSICHKGLAVIYICAI